MKSNKFLIATLLILVGIGAITVSCKKEEKRQSRKAELVVEENLEKTGDDDDDPIIQTRVKRRKTNGLIAVDSAYVEVITYGTNLRVSAMFTDSLGECKHHVIPGTYYFVVTELGTPYYTDTLYVYRNQNVDIIFE